MNPPTAGHEKLIQKIISVSKEQSADHIVFLSQTNKLPDDPLNWQYKVQLANAVFPGVNISTNASIKTPFQALEQLGKVYDNVTLVVGEDRVSAFEKQMSLYTDEWGIKNFNVISAGERDPDAEGAEGASASKARNFAAIDDIDSFVKMMPSTINNNMKHTVFQKLNTVLGEKNECN